MTQQQFEELIGSATTAELIQNGFRKWGTMNAVIKENIKRKNDPGLITIPVFEAISPDEAAEKILGLLEGDIVKAEATMLFDLGDKEGRPIKFLEEDEDILLIPGSLYDSIPNGTILTSINGESHVFKAGKTDNDTRFGCLAYGVTRRVEL